MKSGVEGGMACGVWRVQCAIGDWMEWSVER